MKDSWRRAAVALITASVHCSMLQAQNEHVLALTGAAGIEELDESVIERYEALERHRIHINTASRSSLISCGLFSPFQVAAIDDWRRTSGDILSVTELSSIEGFNPTLAAHMAPYLDFSSRAGIGRSTLETDSSHELICRSQVRKDEEQDADTGWGLKYRYLRENRGGVSIAARNSYGSDGMSPDTWSLCASLQGKRHMDKLVVGDFNAHFGQGLAMWSGFSLSGLSTVDAFCKRAGGISPTWSFAATSYRGAATSFTFGRWTATGMAAFPGLRAAMEKGRGDITLLPAANISWLGRKGQFSLSGYTHGSADAKLSADTRWHAGGFDLYGEAALDARTGAIAGLGGVIWSPGWQHSYALMLRSYPHTYTPGQAGAARTGSKVCDETAVSIGMKLPWMSLTADAALFPTRQTSQLKIVGKATWNMTEHVCIIPRISYRIKDGESRTDLRADLKHTRENWEATARTNLVRCRGWAWLQYIEFGRRTDRVSAWLRASAFRVDNWDDRIYVYERDAPGSFNVPAYYGRGLSASAVCGWKWRKTRLHLRASMVHYASDKPSRVELRCQYSVLL